MIYNEKYDKWFTKSGLVYRYSKSKDKLELCVLFKKKNGYLYFSAKNKHILHHRALYEIFVSVIPEGYQIDHINTVRDDNRLENLRVVTRSENMLNPLTIQHNREAHIGKKLTKEHKQHVSESQIDKPKSEFGKKYIEHFGYGRSKNINQYKIEWKWYKKLNGKCRWEDFK